MTEAEQKLWHHLRAHRLDEQKFRRQQPIGRYVVDFVHFGAKLIVEADGSQHLDSTRDEVRDSWLQSQGFRIMRFWNNDILQNTESVLTAIFDAVSSPLSHEGRGERNNSAGLIKLRKASGRPTEARAAQTMSTRHWLPNGKSPSPLVGEGLGRGGTLRRIQKKTGQAP